jgi:hypothetical protein
MRSFSSATPTRSLYPLCFSRSTGYPHTRDCPLAHLIEAGRFHVEAPDNTTVLWEGDVVRSARVFHPDHTGIS